MLFLILKLSVLLNCIFYSQSWHAYDTTFEIAENCPSYAEATKPLSKKLISKLKLWPDLMSEFDMEHGETIYGAAQGLELIHKSQNPPNCSEAKFIIGNGWPYGFGSRIHMEGIGLAIAMNLGRVYLPQPDGDNIFWETQVPFCQEEGVPTFECFYERWSKCTMADVYHGTSTTDVNRFPKRFMGDFAPSFETVQDRAAIVDALSDTKAINLVMTYGGGKWDATHYIPHQVMPIIECSPVVPDAQHYWWRAISGTYIARPNARAIQKMEQLATLPIHNYRECIAMHIRHGDKGIDMKLIETETYLHVAQYLWNNGLVPVDATIDQTRKAEEGDSSKMLSNYLRSHNGSLFVGSEDYAAILATKDWGDANGWHVVYTDLFDRSIQTAAKDWNEQHKKGTVAIHDALEYLSMMLNLQYAAKCEAWICTMPSNTCRIMDEFRATVGGKANRAYADLSPETCEDPPCIGEGILSFGE